MSYCRRYRKEHIVNPRLSLVTAAPTSTTLFLVLLSSVLAFHHPTASTAIFGGGHRGKTQQLHFYRSNNVEERHHCRHQQQQQPRRAAIVVDTTNTGADDPAEPGPFDEIKGDGSSQTSVSELRSVTFCYLDKTNDEPDLLCDFLMELGACSASITDADRGTDLEAPIFGEPSLFNADNANNVNVDDAWQETINWAAPIWNRCNVTAHFPASIELPSVLEMIATTFGDDDTSSSSFSSQQDTLVSVETVPNRDWVVHVQKSWKPIVVANKFILRFPWHTDQDVAKVVMDNGQEQNKKDNDNHNINMVELQLQGGIAFGTGEHPTTQLCLEWIDRVVTTMIDNATTKSDKNDDEQQNLKILDYGAGSGVLGMAACKLAEKADNNNKVKLEAVGIDIDVDACRIANANAVNNNVSMRNYLPPLRDTADSESKSLLLRAHAHAQKILRDRGESPLGDNHELLLPPALGEDCAYDAVVANILAGPLVGLASTLTALVKAGGGVVGMSGILPHQSEQVVAAYTAAGLENVRVEKELGGWILVTGTKP